MNDDLDDDRLIGRVLTRREVLALFGSGAGAALLAACLPSVISSPTPTATSESAATTSPSATPSAAASASEAAAVPSCIVRPELTEGPYFVDERLNRSDIRSDPTDGTLRDGARLDLAFAVSRIDGSTCTPFEGALVDVWHCDALGVYSDVEDPNAGSTVGQKFLRGYQVTDANGSASFTTIYPGWYRGRAVHIHFKIRTDADADQGLEFTSQLFFDDSLSDTVYAGQPYAGEGERDTRNDDDGIYGQGGDRLLLDVRANGDGYTTTFEIGVQVA